MKNLSRRLVRLEARAAVVTREMTREPHILCFVDTDMKVACEFNMGTGVWTHFKDRPAFAGQSGKLPITPDIALGVEGKVRGVRTMGATPKETYRRHRKFGGSSRSATHNIDARIPR